MSSTYTTSTRSPTALSRSTARSSPRESCAFARGLGSPLRGERATRNPTGVRGLCPRTFAAKRRNNPRPYSLSMVGPRLKEPLRHSAISGLGSIVARVVGVLPLPLYTRYLSPSDYGLIETLVALSAVLTALVAQAMKSAFFRFYFDSAEPERRLLVVRNAFWGVLPDSAGVLMEEMALDDPSSWAVVGVDGQD